MTWEIWDFAACEEATKWGIFLAPLPPRDGYDEYQETVAVARAMAVIRRMHGCPGWSLPIPSGLYQVYPPTTYAVASPTATI